MKSFNRSSGVKGGKKEMVNNIEGWLFGGSSDNSIMTGFSVRHPTLGEGHGAIRGFARLTRNEDNINRILRVFKHSLGLFK